MTDQTASNAQAPDLHTSTAAHGRLKARYRSEAKFKYAGMSAVLLAVLFLVLLLWTIVGNAYLAFTYHYVNLPVSLEQSAIDPDQTGDATIIGQANYGVIARDAMKAVVPFAKGRKDRRARNRLLTSDAGIQIREAVLDDPSLIGSNATIPVQLDDVGDLYFKDQVTKRRTLSTTGIATPTDVEGSIEILSTTNDFDAVNQVINDNLVFELEKLRAKINAKGRSKTRLESQVAAMQDRVNAASDEEKQVLQSRFDGLTNDLQKAVSLIEADTKKAEALDTRIKATAGSEAVTTQVPSFLIRINSGVVKVKNISSTGITGDVLVPLKTKDAAAQGAWSLEVLEKPEDNRKLSDKEIVWLDYMSEKGLIESKFNSVFFTAGASREPEQAGILGAIMGSLYTMIVTLLLSFPIGVAAAIYLEEFAPKNKLTHIIEVNINNLAAVPSIVFGLLGLAMFLNVFGLPRSAPLVGGMVLALMTLPTIIIASRAALRSVPPSIREAALGIGASKLQTVTHHVLPLAMPGILTGTIIGMAQALGETAPLLMIGMVAFIVDIPGGPLDPATVLPVQIFMWADFPEPAFQQKTSAAILVLLAFLVTMNALAVILRKRFERRW